jgi:hypothetical protein
MAYSGAKCLESGQFRAKWGTGYKAGWAFAMREVMRKLICGLFILIAMPAVVSAQTLRDQILKNGVSEEVVIADYPVMSVRALTAAAGAVVHVAVRSSDTFLSSDGGTVLTDYRVAIVDVLKDSASHLIPGDVVTIRRVGGTLYLEGRTFFSNEAGFSPFASGAEYVLFLKTESGQPFEMFAGPQSAYLVHQGTVASLAHSTPRPTLVPMQAFMSDIREVSGRINGTR